MSHPLPELDEILAPYENVAEAEVTAMANASGVPRGTLWKVLRGYTRKPSYEVIRRITLYASERGQ
jgi:predicted transcriptional regulator